MRILVVDDKKLVLSQVTNLIEEFGPAEVVTADNGLDGYEKAIHDDFDLYIIDHLMPLMNGPTLVKNLKQKEATKNTPILFLTTQPLDVVQVLPEYELFDSVINKPIDIELFNNHLETILSKNSKLCAL